MTILEIDDLLRRLHAIREFLHSTEIDWNLRIAAAATEEERRDLQRQYKNIRKTLTELLESAESAKIS